MARVTLEDCTDKMENRFELVAIASQRAKELNSGVKPLVERDNDKDPVIALREIAENKLDIDALRVKLVKKHRKFNKVIEEDTLEEDVSSDVISEMSGLEQGENETMLSTMYQDEAEIISEEPESEG